ncbi:MAG TPA: class I SAM-dependent methyltransferase [Trebonia sp.]
MVETGTALGLGSCIFAAALLRNGHGRLTTIDSNPESGYLIGDPWASVIDLRTGSSTGVLKTVPDVDMFIHASLHTYDYETAEFTAVEPKLRPNAIALSYNSHETSALSNWAGTKRP